MKSRILFGITGSIAAYKSLELIRLLTKDGNDVKVVMTENATRLLAPLACQVLTRNRVLVDAFDPYETGIHHISLADWADILIVAPATANIIGKTAAGIGDDLLSTLIISFKKKIVFVPAMDEGMWNNQVVRENVKQLSDKGYIFISPVVGELASGKIGQGHFPSIMLIYHTIQALLEDRLPLKNKRFLLTAGRTYEMLDPFRVVTNLSSGRMGTALSYAILSRGGQLKAIFGEVTSPLPEGVEIIRAYDSAGMESSVLEHLPGCDVLIMAAAVADYRSDRTSEDKIKGDEVLVKLVKTKDILKSASQLKRSDQVFIGFSLETENMIERGWEKLTAKGLDILVVNDRDSIGDDKSNATLLFKNKTIKELGRISKWDLANRILDECCTIQ